jgi:isopentenyl-diphosphate delta-isomerase
MDSKKKFETDAPGSAIQQRKLEHVQIVLDKQAGYKNKTTGFELVDFEHNALPELDFDQIDTTVTFLGSKLQAPLMITGMTGGYGQAEQINGDLAAAADKEGVVFGLGSMRALFEEPSLAKTYGVRKRAPKAFLCGNIGGIQLKKMSTHTISTVLSDLQADALCVHLNPMHEASQKEGDLDWRGVLSAIAKLCSELKLPVIAKEVGTGISASVALKLENAGVKAIDVSGAGGTSWAGGVEFYRGGSPTAELFWDWGIPTATALKQCSAAVKVPLVASGGIRNGLDAAKSIRLGATLAGAAAPFLKAQATGGEEGVRKEIRKWKRELATTMFGTGSKDLAQLRKAPLLNEP